jgi:hypothetical protein
MPDRPHHRARTTLLIDPANLKVDQDFELDERYLRLMGEVSRGDLKIGLTRLPEEAIHTGFYRRRGGKSEHVTNLKRDLLADLIWAIRTGWRPEIELYWSPLAPGGGAYVCPDDELTLAAYRTAKIRLIPCRILRPKATPLEEAAIWIGKDNGGTALIREIAPARPRRYPAFKSKSSSLSDVCHSLTKACESVCEAIRGFHRTGGELHFHQMLHAAVLRHQRIIESVDLLASDGRAEHAGALARVCYEAFLNFYLDWLSPEFFGPRLQLLAFVREKSLPNAELAPLNNFTELFENTSRKARIGPLGEHYHQSIYPALSLIAHQSYAYLEREASSFGVENLDQDRAGQQLAVWLNILTAALLSRIANDVGLGPDLTPR